MRYCIWKDERWWCNDPKSRRKDHSVTEEISREPEKLMPYTPWSYTALSNCKNYFMEKRRFRPHRQQPLLRKRRASWPRGKGGDFLRQAKLRSRFLLMLRLKVTNPKLQASFCVPFFVKWMLSVVRSLLSRVKRSEISSVLIFFSFFLWCRC